MYSGKVLSVK